MKRSERLSRLISSRNARTGIGVNNSRIKGKKAQLTPRQILLIIFLLFLFMASGIGFVWSNFEMTQIGYDLSQLKKEELRLKDMNRKLRLELSFLKSPENLESQATRRFGLKQPTHEQIIILP